MAIDHAGLNLTNSSHLMEQSDGDNSKRQQDMTAVPVMQKRKSGGRKSTPVKLNLALLTDSDWSFHKDGTSPLKQTTRLHNADDDNDDDDDCACDVAIAATSANALLLEHARTSSPANEDTLQHHHHQQQQRSMSSESCSSVLSKLSSGAVNCEFLRVDLVPNFVPGDEPHGREGDFEITYHPVECVPTPDSISKLDANNNDTFTATLDHFYKIQTAEQNKCYYCARCNVKFEILSRLIRHVLTKQHLNVRYVCRHCPSNFARSEDREKHERNMHGVGGASVVGLSMRVATSNKRLPPIKPRPPSPHQPTVPTTTTTTTTTTSREISRVVVLPHEKTEVGDQQDFEILLVPHQVPPSNLLEAKRGFADILAIRSTEREPRYFCCAACKCNLSGVREMLSHLVKFHLKTKFTWQCSVCLANFKRHSARAAHMTKAHASHRLEGEEGMEEMGHEGRPRRISTITNCPVCAWQCESFEDLEAHMIVDHCSVPIYGCISCPLRFTSRKHLQVHKTLSHALVHCPCCEFVSERVDLLRKHFVSLHADASPLLLEETIDQAVELCHAPLDFLHDSDNNENDENKASDVDNDLEDEEGEAGEGDEEEEEADFEGDRVDILKMISRKRSSTGKEKLHRCFLCNGRFTRNYHLQRHLRNVHSKSVTCPHCQALFEEATSLNEHIHSVHEQTTTAVVSLPADIVAEAGEEEIVVVQPETPPQSPLLLLTKSSSCSSPPQQLPAAVAATTLPDKVIKCDLCHLEFKYLTSIEHHMRGVHNMAAKFECKRCSSIFTFQSFLDQHIQMVHTPRQYICQFCNSKFGRSSHLSRHIRNLHEKSKFKCKLCKFGYPKEAQLIEHIQKEHVGVIGDSNVNELLKAQIESVLMKSIPL